MVSPIEYLRSHHTYFQSPYVTLDNCIYDGEGLVTLQYAIEIGFPEELFWVASVQGDYLAHGTHARGATPIISEEGVKWSHGLGSLTWRYFDSYYDLIVKARRRDAEAAAVGYASYAAQTVTASAAAADGELVDFSLSDFSE